MGAAPINALAAALATARGDSSRLAEVMRSHAGLSIDDLERAVALVKAQDAKAPRSA